jgi:hypothetical protein
MARYLIAGAGKFGRLALTRLAAADPDGVFRVVDKDPGALAALGAREGLALVTLEGDAAAVLADLLADGSAWDWIIPMVPGHLAYRWLLAGPLRDRGWVPIPAPEDVAGAAPSWWRGPEGEIYVSRAGHLCPDDCAEPECCPVTGETREPPLYDRLAALALPGWRVLILASRQLAPGVGGYAPADLHWLARQVEETQENTILLATACRCHGVAHGLRRQGVGAK